MLFYTVGRVVSVQRISGVPIKTLKSCALASNSQLPSCARTQASNRSFPPSKPPNQSKMGCGASSAKANDITVPAPIKSQPVTSNDVATPKDAPPVISKQPDSDKGISKVNTDSSATAKDADELSRTSTQGSCSTSPLATPKGEKPAESEQSLPQTLAPLPAPLDVDAIELPCRDPDAVPHWEREAQETQQSATRR